MKRVKLIIDNCVDCPWSTTMRPRDWYCDFDADGPKRIDDPNEIPDWCPLEDTQEDLG